MNNQVVLWFDRRKNHVHVVEKGLNVEAAKASVDEHRKDKIPAFYCTESFLKKVAALGTTVTYDEEMD